MEASCCLTSKSFTKSSDLAPFLKARHNTSLQRKRHFAISSDLHSSSTGDDKAPSVESDWRFFRARLVAAEQMSKIAMPPTSPASDESPTSFAVGNKWAHPLPEPEKGCLLIATEKLDGVHIFERTVILLLSTGLIGSSGVILNRPSLMSIKETTRSTGTFSNQPLFFGGPLEDSLFLVGPQEEGEDGVGESGVFNEVMKGLYYGTKECVGCAAEMVRRNMAKVQDFRFFDGYCGWEREQLKQEIRAGYWSVAACSPSVIGLCSTDGLWEEVLGLVGQRKVW